ncbi:MAG: hypothetical protein HFI29_05160 [Lachnospiraceae bacterium]|nr:hypothetical protein [Lachnospiraceae bacterium]
MRRRMLLPCLILSAVLCGCGAGEKTGEVSVPQVRQANESEQAEENKTESVPEEGEPAPGLTGFEPGAFLGEEEVILMEEGEPVSVSYRRIQGIDGFTIAYDPAAFTLEAGEEELCFYASSHGPDSKTPVFVKIWGTEGASTEALADQYVADSNEECTVEEVTIGEGEYPATWISYAEGTEGDSRTCDLYIFRYNEKLYTVWMDCFVEAYEGLGSAQESILSTLRFDEG